MEVECLALKDLTSPRKGLTVELQEEEEDGGQSEQKENICTDRRRSTPLKSAESTVPALLMNRKGATPDLAHITPIKHTTLVEPWTPTANLKMLISAASPDIRDREMKKVLFRPIENEKDKPMSPDAVVEDTEVEDPSQFEAAEEEDDADKKPSRKQKSLGLLCQKFLALYPDYPPPHSPIWISLDEVATSLGVERRRIYDIVNVLESLMIVGRMAKNSYTWYGRQRLEATLKELQQRGRDQGYHLQMELASEARELGPGREDDGGEGDSGNAGGNRKDKSLRIMSQKFVMLFLVSKTQTVTLDAAAKILIEESQDSSSHSKYKTKVRRLYDIANVLTSLGLIKKVHVREERGRKPAFKWLGPVEFNHSINAGDTVSVAAVSLPGATQPMTNQDLRKAKMARHASFNITPTSVGVKRQVSSAPSSPRREPPGLPNQPVDYSKRTRNNTVCRLQFGNSTDDRPGSALQTPTCSSSLLPSPTTHPTLLAPSLHSQHLLTPSSSSHCLAYLPSLSQPSVVMLYRALDKPDETAEGQRSPRLESEEGRKRKMEEREDEGTVVKKKGTSGLEECDKMRAEAHREAAGCSQTGNSRTSPSCPSGLPREQTFAESPGGSSSEPSQPSHYLYVPNNAGLNSLNFLLSAGQSPAGLALPPSSVPTLALPYVLLPSAALSGYPLLASGLPQQGSDAHNKLSFSLPAVMSPAHFMVGTVPYGLAAASDISKSPIPSPSTPEHNRPNGSAAGAPHSPSRPCQTVTINTPEPLAPLTPKETTASASKAFFQTPGTLGNVVSAMPAARKRGSAQRRLDVSHSASS
uniref:transcription factor E2F7 n=1 Tax=Scatophagus argus TaxID=75038 RepID=UPI001ED8205F|nr:transcription factor E2F7 [Scatophagus argus]XP_046235358.1 transcription factor E2F7 [Scatophagus argus]